MSPFPPSMRRISLIFILALLTSAVTYAQSDTEPPKILSLSISPTSVDVTSSLQTVTLTVHLTDNLSGIDPTFGRGVSFFFTSPSGTQTTSGSPVLQPGVILLDTTLSIIVPVRRYSEPGTWKISALRLGDNAGNTAFLDSSALAAAGLPTSFDVIDATPDMQAPQLASVTLSPSSVDVSAGDSMVTADLALTDNLSGVGWSSFTLQDFELRSPSGKQSRLVSSAEFHLVSGTTTNGVWRATFNIPRYSEPGTWKLSALRLQDIVRNVRAYGPADLAVFGPSTELTVNSSPSDTTPPQLVGMTFTPSFINTSLGPQTVQVEMAIVDDLAGASFRSDTRVSSRGYGTTFLSPSGAQSRHTNSILPTGGEIAPTTGTPTNGTWSFTVTLPQFSEEGTWSASSLVKDRTRNISEYSAADLLALGMPNQLVVIRPSLVVDGSITDPASGGSVSDSTFGSRATLIVPAGVLSQPTSVAIDVLQSPLAVPQPAGFSTAETYFMNIELTPQPTYPLPAPGMTLVLPLRNYQIPGTLLTLFHVDPSTGKLIPYLDGAGQPLGGKVNAGGLTVTFNGVNHFSTVVGLLPDAIRVNVDVKPGEAPNVINRKSKGTIPVAIMSTPTFDVTKANWATLSLSGAGVAQNKKGKWQVSIVDVNGDGLDDVIAHFQTEQLLLGPADTQVVVEGQTADGRRFRGIDSVKILK